MDFVTKKVFFLLKELQNAFFVKISSFRNIFDLNRMILKKTRKKREKKEIVDS